MKNSYIEEKLLVSIFYYLRRHAAHDSQRRDIFDYDGIRCDDGPGPDRHSLQDGSPSRDPHVIAYDDRRSDQPLPLYRQAQV
jgi:hypothetical protein